MTPKRNRFTTRIILTEESYGRPNRDEQHDALRRSVSPATGRHSRGVNVRPVRRTSLEELCLVCVELFKRGNTLDLLWVVDNGREQHDAVVSNGQSKEADNGQITVNTTLNRVHVIPKEGFLRSAVQTCRLCQALGERFRHELRSVPNVFESTIGSLSFPFSFDRSERTITFHDASHLESKALVFDLVAHRGSKDMLGTIKRQPPEIDVASERSFKQASNWLACCVEKHHQDGSCPKFEMTRLPKRVIDVGGPFPRLHLSKGASGRYACLSYCWGDAIQVLTYKDTLSRHSEKIVYENLPRTVQDAIIVTRRLKLRYIWVDCLCIVQDDQVEREQELENMGSIFANAYVTISAATAKSSQDGFLNERESQSRAYTPPINIPCYSPSGRNDHIMLFQRGSATTREVIHNRAWTLQEDLLSPRILFYGDFELVWVCKTGVRTISGIQAEICEDGETELARLRRIFSDSDELSDSTFDLKHGDEEKMARWEDLIREYSKRKLSREDDKLPALAGLAAKFEPLVKAEYLAGLWICWLPTHLLWRVVGGSGSGSEQSNWRAPTWSWLSMNSPVKMDVGDSKHFKALATVENYAIKAVKLFQLLGRLKSASITLRGVFNQASDQDIITIAEVRNNASQRIPKIVLDVRPVFSSSYYPEYAFLTIGYVEPPPLLSPPPTSSPIRHSKQNSRLSNGSTRRQNNNDAEKKVALGLVLSPAQVGTDCYIRVGWFKSLPQQTEFLNGKEKIVTIL
jgi:hypothetical protein